jgi:hypothetical protein
MMLGVKSFEWLVSLSRANSYILAVMFVNIVMLVLGTRIVILPGYFSLIDGIFVFENSCELMSCHSTYVSKNVKKIYTFHSSIFSTNGLYSPLQSIP